MSQIASPEAQKDLRDIEKAAADGKLATSSVENLRRWLTEVQYEPYRPQIHDLVAAGGWERLDLLFYEVIPFGTGGRRGLMADLGSATINVRTVAESAHGLATYLKSQIGSKQGSAVIARDTRNRSAEFARLTATTLAANGLKVYFFGEHRSTPELSFAVRHLKCDVGVVISASHNPPADNGFKAYWSSGGQVLPPHDKGIIRHVYESGAIPTLEFDRAVSDGKIVIVGEELDRAYIAAVQALSLSKSRDVGIVFTPLHGGGETNVYEVLHGAGFKCVEILESQREPNGNFPNVPDHFPNPERPQVFDAAIARAKKTGADLVFASDPDADRIGVAAKGQGGEFRILSGNQVGALCVDYVLRKRAAAGTLSPRSYVIETMVTTPLIAAIARSHNVRCFDNLLVGFKYIGQTMDREGPEDFVFGAEESLGYLAGSYARDKDAAVGALFIAELAAELRADGKTLLDRLDELYVEHGYYLEGQRSETCPGPTGRQQIEAIMAAFRTSPPQDLAGVTKAEVRHYKQNEIRSLPKNIKMAELPEPTGDLMFLDSAPGDFRCSIAVRPSGTEPKIKFYFFASAAVSEPSSLASVKALTNERLKAVQDAVSAWVRQQVGHNGR
jgi:phosphoglucomutase/phosphomannomutase